MRFPWLRSTDADACKLMHAMKQVRPVARFAELVIMYPECCVIRLTGHTAVLHAMELKGCWHTAVVHLKAADADGAAYDLPLNLFGS